MQLNLKDYTGYIKQSDNIAQTKLIIFNKNKRILFIELTYFRFAFKKSLKKANDKFYIYILINIKKSKFILFFLLHKKNKLILHII